MANVRRAARWFLIAGAMGVLIAIFFYILGAFSFSRPFVAHVAQILSPAMILGLAEPSSGGAITLLLALVLVTNFALYGILGLVLCGAWSWVRQATRFYGANGPRP
jgi:hypothetical protein